MLSSGLGIKSVDELEAAILSGKDQRSPSYRLTRTLKDKENGRGGQFSILSINPG